MFGFIRPGLAPGKRERAPEWVSVKGGFEFPIAKHLDSHHGYPIVDWQKAQAWVDTLAPESRRREAWSACERAWLLHFRDALGTNFRLEESESAAVVSSLEARLARTTLDFMARTSRRIVAVLRGIAETAPRGKDILIAFDDQESCYRYVSYYYPESGEFAMSGGMHLNKGCAHFVTVKGELWQLEATIVHEMTHAYLEHLPLPLWLNEGLAVNTERRLAGSQPRLPLGALERVHDRLRRFWSAMSIQDFWSGASFQRPGESNELSYELARIIVEQLAKDWEPFVQFVRHADRADAGAAAAQEYLGVELGRTVIALLERETPRSWSPEPGKWKPE